MKGVRASTLRGEVVASKSMCRNPISGAVTAARFPAAGSWFSRVVPSLARLSAERTETATRTPRMLAGWFVRREGAVRWVA